MLMTPEELADRERVIPAGNQGPLNTISQKYVQVRGGTRREQRLLVAVVVFFVLALILVIVLIGVHSNYDEANRKLVPYCDKEECVKSGAELVQALDRSSQPCDDFYRFACGRFGRAHPLPERGRVASWFSERSRALDARVAEALSSNGTGDPNAVKQLRNFYASCIDVDAQNAHGEAALETALSRLGLALAPPGLPAPHDASRGAPSASLGSALGRAQRVASLDVLLELSTAHDRNNTVRMLRVSPARPAALSTPPLRWAPGASRSSGASGWLVPPPDDGDGGDGDGLPLEAARPSAKEVFAAEVVYMARVIRHLADARKPSDAPALASRDAAALATKLLLFEGRVRNMTARDRPKGLNTTWYDFQKILDSSFAKENSSKEAVLDLEEYVKALSDDLNHTIDFYNDVIFVSDVVYFKRMARFIAREGTIPAQRYLWWRTVHELLPYSTLTLRKHARRLREVLTGAAPPRTPRTRICTSLAKEEMAPAVTYAVGQKYPLGEIPDQVEEILSDIRESFRVLVRGADWMDRKTQDATIDKMYSVTSFVGYPEWLGDGAALDRRYEGLQLDPKKFLDNHLTLKAITVKQIIESLGVNDSMEPYDSWETIDPVQVNAFYSRLSNSIVIPAGILQRPFFRIGHGALSYGAIGAILGHELTHGFDSEGHRFDKHGRRAAWWSRRSTREFDQRAQCFVRQYDRYRMPGRHKLDGRLTLAENIADNGGVREALLAYRSFLRRHGAEPPPPGLAEFSPEQLFFLGYANLWCHDGTPAYDKASVRDPHSPARFRVLGTLANSPDFAKAWNCPTQSPMNPMNKCIIW